MTYETPETGFARRAIAAKKIAKAFDQIDALRSATASNFAPAIHIVADAPQTDLAGLSLRQLLARYTVIVAEIDQLTAEIGRMSDVTHPQQTRICQLEDLRSEWIDRRNEIFAAALPLKPADLAEAQAKARVLGQLLVSVADDSDEVRTFLEAMAGPLDHSALYD